MLQKVIAAALIATPLIFGVVFAGAQDKSAGKKGAPAAATVEKKGENVDKDKRGASPQTDAVARTALADQLARHGDAHKDSLALITAARILQQAGSQDIKADGKSEGKPARDMSVNGMLDRARQYAGGRKDIIAMADETAKSGSRGATGSKGAGRWRGTVKARTTDVLVVTFRGTEPAMVTITGDGDSDLDLIIRDESGNVVCASQNAGDHEVCRWNPRWTGPFRIEVKNSGSIYNHYSGAHN